MEDLANNWKKLSLSEKEGDEIDLSGNKKTTSFVLAAKFFTCRSLNLEAGAKTFMPLWRTRDNFEVSDAGNNKLLFAFQSKEDMEKVLMGEPWSFNRQWFFKDTRPLHPLRNSISTKFLFGSRYTICLTLLLSAKVARSIRETLGKVSMPKDISELRGGNFLHIRVAIDVNEPLCRGRCVRFDKDNEGWVSFAYKHLPNLCYWCGQLTHDDKNCAIWLQSRGSLSSQDQQYGAWLRAGQFNPSNKMVVAVQGYSQSKS